MSKLITSFFTNNGVPALGLTPTIRIWSVTDTSETIVIQDQQMVEMGDGFYKFSFSGYDPTLNYTIRVDGGGGLNNDERYQVASNESFADDIAEHVWDEPKINHIQPGTFGEAINAIDANVDQLRLDVASMYQLVEILVKFETNRTVIDKPSHTLTVYDNDGITPIHVFELYNSLGDPSVDEVCERVPV